MRRACRRQKGHSGEAGLVEEALQLFPLYEMPGIVRPGRLKLRGDDHNRYFHLYCDCTKVQYSNERKHLIL